MKEIRLESAKNINSGAAQWETHVLTDEIRISITTRSRRCERSSRKQCVSPVHLVKNIVAEKVLNIRSKCRNTEEVIEIAFFLPVVDIFISPPIAKEKEHTNHSR
ncbi:hypothetical protein NPIL_99221 [Nephila pilipes]|uniref:Uncharacterized protein n=1 Tax=Nephila pilipes TaxID=299642 RepID=A0A8X6TS19_NEPPI|nr:hypothetical protein NPIL_99221 [Nephila pilipes]